MDENTFKDFGNALDMLERIKLMADDEHRKLLTKPFMDLVGIYQGVKEDNDYKDRSDFDDDDYYAMEAAV